MLSTDFTNFYTYIFEDWTHSRLLNILIENSKCIFNLRVYHFLNTIISLTNCYFNLLLLIPASFLLYLIAFMMKVEKKLVGRVKKYIV